MKSSDTQMELVRRYLGGEATLEEARRLESMLAVDAQLRRDYLAYARVEAGLSSKVRPKLVKTAPPNRWLSWRPLTAAAAGIVLGMCCTSVVFGYVMPRAVATASRLFALVDGSFEKQSGHLPAGFPVQFGAWSGDESEIVEKPSVEAKDGNRALRFVRAEREVALPNYGAASCDVYQLIDLRPLKADAAIGEATLELSVQFLDSRESAGEPVMFFGRMYVFAGTPETLPEEWPMSKKEALASGSCVCDSVGGSFHGWQAVSTKVLLPPQADFAVVQLVAHKPKSPAGTEASFGEQYADDVRLTLKTQPTLPVRVAQR